MTRSRPTLAVIAGTGVAEHFATAAGRSVTTRFGKARVYLESRGRFYVLPRHGPGHGTPPHRINYRANIAGLHRLGVSKVIATSAVGSMNPDIGVGEIGLLGQFIDFTKCRASTFFDDEVSHVDMTSPYSEVLNSVLKRAGAELGIRLHAGLVYACTEGPRFETPAEVRMLRMLGADVVGMTGVPEVVLANELGLEYASVVIVTNWAAGMQGAVSHEDVVSVMREAGGRAKTLVEAAAKLL